jgi:SAM-dependent methyltransferase
MMKDVSTCRLCSAPTVEVGRKFGDHSQQWYDIRHCPTCRFSFVVNPYTDYTAIYSAEYYAGRGADPLVDYLFELECPRATIRQYEWAGIVQVIQSLTILGAETQWLDFGCGNGGLVRYVRANSPCAIVGFEEGWIRDQAVAMGIPIIDRGQLDACVQTFDIVTAIEVLEHVVDPLAALRSIHRMLKPGGLFFFTTGNAQPFRSRLLSWQYVIPEIHVSFFEPETLRHALVLAGFRPEFKGFLPGFTDIIRFKVLKNLHLRRASIVEQMLPWSVLTRLIDFRRKITAHPIGWAAPCPSGIGRATV